MGALLETWIKGRGTLRFENIAHLPRNRAEYIRAERNMHLRRAGAALGDLSPWTRAVALEKEIAAFEEHIWPGWRDLDAPPERESRLRLHLFHAFKCVEPMEAGPKGPKVPRTAMGLHPLFQLTKDKSA